MNQKAILKVIRVIRENKTFLLSTHVNADADGIACELSMAAFLKSLNKTVYIINAEDVPGMYKFFPNVRLIKKFRGQRINYDVAVIFDCGVLRRIGNVQKIIKKEKSLINIDHHATNDRFGSLNFVKSRASSTSEMVYDIFKAVRFKITKPIAKLLYLGIMTDTGSFRYDNTTPYSHEVVSKLLRFNFTVNKMYKSIYENIPLKDLKYFVKLVSSFEITHRSRVVSVTLTKRVLKKISGDFDLRDRIFTFLRAIKDVEVVLIFRETRLRATRINFRSQGNIDVARLASLYDGGGHKRASGCYIPCSIKEAKQEIHKQLKKVLK